MIREEINHLELKKVVMRFGQREILSNSSFLFPLHCNCCFVFGDEISKFFFFHAISQITGFEQGQFLINKENVLDLSFEEFLPYRLNMGFGFSTRGLLSNRTLHENALLPVTYHHLMTESEAKEWVDYLFDYFDVTNFMHSRPAEASPSAQKAALLIRAFVHRPEMIILDSPGVLLANKLQANLLQLIDEHKKHYGLKHLFFATQDEDFAHCLTDQSVILSRGSLNLINHEREKKVAL